MIGIGDYDERDYDEPDYAPDPLDDYEPDPTDWLEQQAMDEWWALPAWRRMAHRVRQAIQRRLRRGPWRRPRDGYADEAPF